MIDRPLLPAPAAVRSIDVVGAVRSTVYRWIGRDDRHAARCRPIRAGADLGPPLLAGPFANDSWMSPPPERRLPRDLDMPLSAFDPGAIRDWRTAGRAASFPDPVMLERTLHRLSELMGR